MTESVDPVDEGGDPACWVHVLDANAPLAVDLTGSLAATGDGVHWTLPGDGDLNANLVHLDPGHGIDEHTNTEVDVLIVVLAGEGTALLGGDRVALAPNVVLQLPKAVGRSLRAGSEGLAYLTVHRRRGPLGIGAS